MRFFPERLKTASMVCLLLASSGFVVHAQTPSDAIMMKPGQMCGGVFYTNSSASEYWQGDSLLANGNVGTLTVQSVAAGFTLGVIKNLDVYAALPFVSSSPSAGFVQGTSGIQDFMLAAKYKILDIEAGGGRFKTLVSASGVIPASDYIPDHPYAIGVGCADAIGRAIVAYKSAPGIFVKAQAGYHLRGNSELVREYYFTDDEGYASTEVDMPNAFDYSATVGFLTDDDMTFKAEAEFTAFNCLGGFDIRPWDQGFPSNEMDFMRIGANFQYIPAFAKGFGIHANTAYTLAGRNVWKAFTVGGGITYFFSVWNKNSETESAN